MARMPHAPHVATGSRSARIFTGMAFALGIAVAAPAPAGDAQISAVENWSQQREGATGIPDGWQGQSWGSPKYDFTVVSDGGRRALHLRSQSDNSAITREVAVDVKRFPLLVWRWKVVTLPVGGDSRRRDRDDQAAQVYVAFPRFPTAARSRIIGYVWDTTAPIGAIVKSQSSGVVTYIVVRSGAVDLGRWIEETRDVYDDYRKIYGEVPAEEARAVSVAIDSNDTHSAAESYIGDILFRSR
jgi:hypothetical protein